jgi:hypothetical protein
MHRRSILTLIAVALVAFTGVAGLRAGQSTAAAANPGPELTVYNQGMALVKDTRTLSLKEGVQTVTVTDVAAQIDPTSVYFKSLTDPAGTTVLEQNFEYDLVGADKLLSKYVGLPIKVVTEDGTSYAGKLLNGVTDIILQDTSGQVQVISRDRVRDFTFPSLPEGLITQPSLVWMVDAAKAGDQQTEISYITNGIGWQATYSLLLAPDGKKLDLSGWVTLDNRSGAAYKDAKLKLIAGDVNVVGQPQPMQDAMIKMATVAPVPQVAERSFAEYHLYEIGRPVTVKDNQTKQIEFITAADVPAEKLYVYSGSEPYGYYAGSGPQPDPAYGADTGIKTVSTILQFDTGKEGVNAALPQGTARVYQEDADGSALLIGEDTIPHTPKNEKVRLNLGNAFDLVGERKQTGFKQVADKVIEESYEIMIRNQKPEEAVQVRVVEHLYRSGDWEIIAESAPHAQIDSQSVEWQLDVPAGGESKLTYTVRYRW